MENKSNGVEQAKFRRLSGRALDAALNAGTNDWSQRVDVAAAAIKALPKLPDHGDIVTADALTDQPSAEVWIPASSSNSSDIMPNGKPRRMRVGSGNRRHSNRTNRKGYR